jgi:hypothetical protein
MTCEQNVYNGSSKNERFFFKLIRFLGTSETEISKWNVEYPEVDRDYVELYPVDLEYIEPNEIFQHKNIRKISTIINNQYITQKKATLSWGSLPLRLYF